MFLVSWVLLFLGFQICADGCGYLCEQVNFYMRKGKLFSPEDGVRSEF